MTLPRMIGIDIGERPAARVSIWIVTILVLAAALMGCASPGQEAVPGCPRCGDPVSRPGGPDRSEAVVRLRIEDGTLGGPGAGKSPAPWSLSRDKPTPSLTN